MIIICVGIQEVGQLSQNLVGKYVFSNPILTLFTYILYASTMYKHIFGLILVTQNVSGIQLNHDNGFQVIELSKSSFPTKV